MQTRVRKLAGRIVGWALLSIAGLAVPAAASMTNCLEATCRITTPDGSRGTGCVFEISHGQVYVLTVAHVVGQNGSVECEFWKNGHQSRPLPGRVLARTRDAEGDAAIVSLDVARFGDVLPGVVPVAAPGSALQPGEPITSAGCPNGAWSTGWKGHVVRLAGDDFQFVPPPAQGRSGSAIFDAEGKQIVGLLRARTIDNQEGIACSVQSLYRQLGFPAQCSGGCPTQPAYGDASGSHLFPKLYQRLHPQAQPTPAAPWPTLPPDYTPLTSRLDRLADAVAGLQPSPAKAPVAPGPDSATAQALEQMGGTLQRHGQAIEQLKTDVPRQIDAAVKPVADVVRPLLRLHDKLEADAEAGGIKGRIAQRILDKVESDGNGDAGLRHTLTVIGIVSGIAAVCVFGVLHLMRTGKGLGGELVEKLAARHPDNERLQALHEKFAAIDAKLASHLPHLGGAAQLAGAGLAHVLPAALGTATLAVPGVGPVAAPVVAAAAAGGADLIHNRIQSLEDKLHKVALNTPAPAHAASAATAPGASSKS